MSFDDDWATGRQGDPTGIHLGSGEWIRERMPSASEVTVAAADIHHGEMLSIESVHSHD